MHIGIIPDGNRRWSREKGLSIRLGHKTGAETLERILSHAVKRYEFVKEISIYCLSTENLVKRTQEEIKDIFEIQADYFNRFSRDPVVHERHVRGRVLGFTDQLPTHVMDAIRRMNEATGAYSKHLVNFLMPYGGQQEVINAAKRVVMPPYGPLALPNLKSCLEENLFVNSPVDLVIRTAENRLSNFLIYQTAYAEYIFLDKFWPSFTTEDLDICMLEYDRRVRRRGE